MASLRACPPSPYLLNSSSYHTTCTKQRRVNCKYGKLNLLVALESKRRNTKVCNSTAREVTVLRKAEDELVKEVRKQQDEYLVRDFGWDVRRMAKVAEEMRRVAYVQAEAFHEPVTLPFVNDILFEFFKAEVLSALMYRLRNSAPDRYACLVAESTSGNKSMSDKLNEIVGVLDVTIQRDVDVLSYIPGDGEEYLYVSGIAVLKNFRRQKVATALLKACDMLSVLWGMNYLALRAHEDDAAARKLYSTAGYRVISRDPFWVTWVGKRRRVLMLKKVSSNTSQNTNSAM